MSATLSRRVFMTQMPASASNSASNGDVPGMGRRQFMNLLTFGSVTGVALGALYPVARYFIPPKAAGGGGGTTAKDELGNSVTASGWLSSHKEGDRSLVQGRGRLYLPVMWAYLEQHSFPLTEEGYRSKLEELVGLLNGLGVADQVRSWLGTTSDKPRQGKAMGLALEIPAGRASEFLL